MNAEAFVEITRESANRSLVADICPAEPAAGKSADVMSWLRDHSALSKAGCCACSCNSARVPSIHDDIRFDHLCVCRLRNADEYEEKTERLHGIMLRADGDLRAENQMRITAFFERAGDGRDGAWHND